MQEPKRGGCLRNADQAIRMHVPYADCSLGLSAAISPTLRTLHFRLVDEISNKSYAGCFS